MSKGLQILKNPLLKTKKTDCQQSFKIVKRRNTTPLVLKEKTALPQRNKLCCIKLNRTLTVVRTWYNISHQNRSRRSPVASQFQVTRANSPLARKLQICEVGIGKEKPRKFRYLSRRPFLERDCQICKRHEEKNGTILQIETRDWRCPGTTYKRIIRSRSETTSKFESC